MMNNLWQKIATFLSKLFGAHTMPPEVANSDAMIQTWWQIFRCKAPWLPYTYVTSDGVKRTRQRFTLNPAKIVCSELSCLVLSETPEVQASQAVLDVIERENFFANLRRATEYQAALGGQALKLYKENDIIKIDFVKAPNFIPLSFDNSSITEASFIDRRTKGDKVYIRVETHKKSPGGYTITNAAFDEKTGIAVSLSSLWGDMPESTFVASELPLFVYIGNPEANNLDPESPLSISIYANAVDTLQGIDLAFDGMKTEILMGRQRVALPGTVMRGYLDPDTGKRKLGFDPTDEAYIRLEGDDADKLKPVDLTGQMRMEQWRMAIQSMLDLLAGQVGFSAGYFSFDGTSMKTATEVVSENSKTYKTVQSFKDVLKMQLEQLFRAIDGISGQAGMEPNVIFSDSVVEDRNSKAKYHQDLVLAGLEDTVSAIKAVHGVDDATAEAMAARIKEEKAVAMPAFPGV